MKNLNKKSICAIICELNPLHNGHKYLFEKAKEQSGCDYLLGIMSANFVQRGEPAIFDCATRAKMALECGLDAVVYLPIEYSTACAEIFCKASVEIAQSFKNVSHLAFGVENIEIEELQTIANILIKNNENLNNKIKANLDLGINYSQAKQIAIKEILTANNINNENLFAPNNVLAMEYIFNLNDNITPIAIQRIKEKNIISATKIRELLKQGQKRKALKYIPKNLHKYYKSKIFDYNKFENFALQTISFKTQNELSKCRDINEGMENLFYKNINTTTNYKDFLLSCTTKRYTKNRINRAILSCLFSFEKNEKNFVKIDKIKLAGIKGEILKYLECNKNLISRVNELKENIYENIDEKSQRLYNKFIDKTNSSFWLDKIIKLEK